MIVRSVTYLARVIDEVREGSAAAVVVNMLTY